MEIVARFKGDFPEKFGVPRQAGLVPDTKGIVELIPPFNHENFIQGLHLYSHLWLTFQFHHNHWNGKPMVRPQRLGGNKKMGVFATRSSFRPNGLGLSAVKIEKVDYEAVAIHVSGHDIINDTPIVCIKPYIPFSDSITEATSEFAWDKPTVFSVQFLPQVEAILNELANEYPALRSLIIGVISQDPTPQFHDDFDRVYGLNLFAFNIRFKKEGNGFIVVDIQK